MAGYWAVKGRKLLPLLKSQPSPGLLSSPRMEIWPGFTQHKVTPAPLLLQDITWPLTNKDEAEMEKNWQDLFLYLVCSLQPFYLQRVSLRRRKMFTELCALESRGLLPPGLLPLLKTNALAQRASMNQKSQNIQLTLRLFSKLIRPPCWKEREGIREEPDLYLEIKAQKFTPVNS